MPYIQVPPDSTGKKVEVQDIDQAGVTVERQVIALGDVAAALYQMIQILQRPMSTEYTTGRMRVSVEIVSATAAIGVSAFAGATPRDALSWQLERQDWAISIGSRIV